MAVRTVTGAYDTIRCDTFMAASLQFLRLPGSQRVVFKTVLMVLTCLHGVAHVHLSDRCIPAAATSGRQYLHSESSRTLLVPRVRTAVGSEVSPSMNRPLGTVCRLHYKHQSCHRTRSQRALNTHLLSTVRHR